MILVLKWQIHGWTGTVVMSAIWRGQLVISGKIPQVEALRKGQEWGRHPAGPKVLTLLDS